MACSHWYQCLRAGLAHWKIEQSDSEVTAMPIEYLRSLERDALPFLERNVANIDKLRVLNAAGMVDVQFAPMNSVEQTAHVLCITGLGCATLRAPVLPMSRPLHALRDLEPLGTD
jgi:hypothetical protein